MEFKTIKKTTKQIELEIKGANETILNPITEKLLQNENVDYASYMADHPQSLERRLYIRLKKGKKVKPEEVLKKAVKDLEEEVKKFGNNFKSKKEKK